LLDGYVAVPGRSTFSTRLSKDQGVEIYLQSFGILLLNRTWPDIPKTKGSIYKGITSALHTFLSEKTGVDITLTRVAQSPSPATVVFGDVWGKSYPTEKKILDFVIHVLRTKCEPANLPNIYLPIAQIAKDKGLNLDFSSDVISDQERVLLQEICALNSLSPVIDWELAENPTLKDIIKLGESVALRQKAIKAIKSCVRNLESSRMTAIYAPYDKAAKKKALKIPVKSLIAEIKHTEHYGAFNPTAVLTLVGQAPLPVGGLTGNDEKVAQTLLAFTQSLSAKRILISSVDSCLAEYQQYLVDLKKA
jgi:hypothetical protein